MSLSTPPDGDSQVTDGQPFPIERSNVYLRWLEEKQHVSLNRWYLSEKLGHDCGAEHAKWDWEMRHRRDWLSGWYERNGARPDLPSQG